ncbi:hypothetical protein NLI96_g12691 [Meripilus lineatus]|uniref:Uncharacterized protein n=1 Tax=Meripilus lineatus TaxID=2056292 RepID=A0AAD5UTD5_9APHY|nr:hypothetical protein NLI96_g12691 [Physisporinus lineatus]
MYLRFVSQADSQRATYKYDNAQYNKRDGIAGLVTTMREWSSKMPQAPSEYDQVRTFLQRLPAHIARDTEKISGIDAEHSRMHEAVTAALKHKSYYHRVELSRKLKLSSTYTDDKSSSEEDNRRRKKNEKEGKTTRDRSLKDQANKFKGPERWDRRERKVRLWRVPRSDSKHQPDNKADKGNPKGRNVS